MITLSLKQNKILKTIVKNYKKDKYIDLNILLKSTKISKHELIQDVSFLILENYIVSTNYNSLIPLPKGRNYLEMYYRHYIQKIIFSFLIPCIIALITAYFTAKFTTPNEVIVHINTIHNV